MQKPLYMFTNMKTMHLHISPNSLISDIQNEFNRLFPFLKIEFFNNKSFTRSNYSASHLIPHQKKIGECQLGIKDYAIEIENEMKVSVLEKLFKEHFNLAVKVLRKSGNLWLETTMTDNWSLEQQNNHGRELSTARSNKPDIEDYDLKRDADRY